jgi:hypothetical protein
MRAILTLACAGVFLAAGAQAQQTLNLCRQIKDGAARLKCYDGLSSSSATAPQAESKPGTDAAWEVKEEKSPLDDSPVVSASLKSDDGKAYLLMRCKERKTELAVSITGLIKCGAGIRVIYRVDQSEATDTQWISSSSCYLAIAPSPIPFIRALSDQSKVFFRIFDHYGAPHDALFNLGKISDVRSRLAQACEWDGAPKATGNPVPNPPAPMVPASPPEAQPK